MYEMSYVCNLAVNVIGFGGRLIRFFELQIFDVSCAACFEICRFGILLCNRSIIPPSVPSICIHHGLSVLCSDYFPQVVYPLRLLFACSLIA